MRTFFTAAAALMLTAATAAPVLAQYPGEPKIPDRSYDPVSEMNYDRQWAMPNEIVRDAQRLLHEQGFYDGAIDGVAVNPAYLRALWNFQKAKGLRPTTHLDAPTLAALGVSATGLASPRTTDANNFGAR
jgi:peptidoglycan hydrolase-like protein with peptidoglycan-binding domain